MSKRCDIITRRDALEKAPRLAPQAVQGNIQASANLPLLDETAATKTVPQVMTVNTPQKPAVSGPTPSATLRERLMDNTGRLVVCELQGEPGCPRVVKGLLLYVGEDYFELEQAGNKGTICCSVKSLLCFKVHSCHNCGPRR